MAQDRPIASLSGSSESERPRPPTVASSRVSRAARDRWSATSGEADRVAELAIEIHALEHELRRSKHRTQYVIDHYEGLLAEQERRLADRRDSTGAYSGLLGALARAIPGL